MVLVGYIPWYPHNILSACFGGQGNVPLSHQCAAKYDGNDDDDDVDDDNIIFSDLSLNGSPHKDTCQRFLY